VRDGARFGRARHWPVREVERIAVGPWRRLERPGTRGEGRAEREGRRRWVWVVVVKDGVELKWTGVG
jgi:hypothetical protein